MKKPFITVCCALLLAVMLPMGAAATTLEYEVKLEGRTAGYMELTVTVDEQDYQIKGRMWSTGLAKFFSNWWSRFTTFGRLKDGKPLVEGHQLVEHSNQRQRAVTVKDGILEELKNGRQKPPRKIDARLDVLSALFFADNCDIPPALFNSKDQYQIVKTASARDGDTLRCEFHVQDSDHDEFSATVWLNRIDGINVPVRVDLKGDRKGSIRLRS